MKSGFGFRRSLLFLRFGIKIHWDTFMADDAAQPNLPQATAQTPPAAPGGTVPDAKKDTRKINPNAIVKFSNEIDINFERPLPEYDIGPVKAYQAARPGAQAKELFALICEPDLIPRHKAMHVYPNFVNTGVLQMVAKRKIFWPSANAERCVIIYKDTLGKKILRPDMLPALGWKQEEVMEFVVGPMVNALLDYRNKDFVHGNIWPGNIFTGNGTRKIILGDCLSTPASYTLPSLYEPIHRSMTDPIGRGLGGIADDMYSFGVTLAVLMRHTDPLAGLSEEEITVQKIEQGTYSAVTGKDRFKGSILELLRGLLQDDATQRWTIEEVVTWLDGRRLSPKQAVRPNRAPRPISFAGEKYFFASCLAMNLPKNPSEATRMMEGDDLMQWLSRALEDSHTVERVAKAVEEVKNTGKGPGYEDKLVSSLCVALDPGAPIRYKKLSFMADGFGNTLAAAMAQRQDTKPFNDLLSMNVILNWITTYPRNDIDVSAMIGRFDSCRNFIRQGKVGFGLERCVYMLSPEAHCLSEKLKDYYVANAEDMIRAFDDMCRKGKVPALFFDRHSTAFLSVRDSKVIDSYLFELEGPEDYKKIMGNLKCLATIQKRYEIDALPALAKAIADMMPIVYERFHDRSVRDKLKTNINRYAETGDLAKMAGLLNNAEITSKDSSAFKAAMREYAELVKEEMRLEASLEDKGNFGKSTGKQVAAAVSCTLAAGFMLLSVFMFFMGQSLF
jgi:eukaryotic-like serine/threonine-protein kinase